jgi:hypothetical protein
MAISNGLLAIGNLSYLLYIYTYFLSFLPHYSFCCAQDRGIYLLELERGSSSPLLLLLSLHAHCILYSLSCLFNKKGRFYFSQGSFFALFLIFSPNSLCMVCYADVPLYTTGSYIHLLASSCLYLPLS